jgi:hypothetical protein
MVDRLMERASAALAAMRYFESERLAQQALAKAFSAGDFDRMARILLPLQEGRRQKRQLATDCGAVRVVQHMEEIAGRPQPGCYLFQPPLIGADARHFRQRADAAKAPVSLLTREPTSRDGKWPIVSVGERSIRTKVDPPFAVSRVEGAATRDDTGERVPGLAWFEAAAEALGDAAIAKIDPKLPAAWRVEDLLSALDAFPEHEKLHQRLEEACREAVMEPPVEGRRPRAWVDDPFAF